MASVILAGTTSTTALNLTGDTSGELQLKTNNGSTTAMTLTTDGNVGIGTTSPFGTAANRTVLSVNGTSTVSLNIGTGGSQRLNLYSDGTIGQVTTIGSLPLVFAPNDTERMRIDSSGNVGIGTSSPGGTLHVQNSAGTHTQIWGATGSVGSYAYMRLQRNTSDGSFTFGTAQQGFSSIAFATSNSSNEEFAERMRITSAGNVGIGLTPTNKFQVAVDGTYTANISANGGNGARIVGTDYGNSTYQPMYVDGSFVGIQTSGTERMRITSGGNVLIGTTATSGNGKFTNALDSATIARFSDASNQLVFSRIQVTNASNNATVDAFRFLDADGNINGAGRVAGHIYLTANGASGANAFSAVYYLLTTSNGTLQATFTAIASQVRGTNPISSVQITDDGAGGAVKITVTYINNSGVVTGGATRVSFVGMLA